jgi:hypothetical protein
MAGNHDARAATILDATGMKISRCFATRASLPFDSNESWDTINACNRCLESPAIHKVANCCSIMVRAFVLSTNEERVDDI